MLCAEFHVSAHNRADDPGPRCGHTLTCVPAEGGGQRLIVFGGATALEGDGSSQGTSGIRESTASQLNPSTRLLYAYRTLRPHSSVNLTLYRISLPCYLSTRRPCRILAPRLPYSISLPPESHCLSESHFSTSPGPPFPCNFE
jgi:hypothetical protein